MNFEKKINLLKGMKNIPDYPKFVYLQNLDNLSLFEEYVKKIEEYFTYIDEYFIIVDSIPIAISSYENHIVDDENHDERGIRGFIRRREPIPYLDFFNENEKVIRFRTKALVKYEEVLAIRKELQKTHRQGFKIRDELEKKYTQGYILMDSINFEILIKMENLITASIILLDKGDPNNDKAYKTQLKTYKKQFETYKKQLYQEQGRLKLPDTIMATPVAQEAAYYKPSLKLSGNQRRYLPPTIQQAERIGGIVPTVMRPRLKARETNLKARETNQEVKQLLSPVAALIAAPPVAPLVPVRPPVAALVADRPPVSPLVAARQSTVRTPRPRQAAARRIDALAFGVLHQHNNKSPSSKNHSFKSKSPPTVEKPVFEIVKTEDGIPPKVYLIDAKDDGLCFLNAIFDYLLYSDKLSIMYERLLAIEKLILKNYGANIDILRIKRFALSRLDVREGTYDLLEKQLIPIIQINEIYHENKKEQGQLIRLTGIQKDSSHPEYEDYTQLYYTDTAKKVEHLGHPKREPETYKNRRINFAISMKYVLALYILSYGKNKFTDIITYAIKNTLFADVPKNSTDPYRNEWNAKLLKYYKDTFKNEYEKGNAEIYRISDEAVATPEDIEKFVYQYVFEYMSDDNKFFANQTLIIMFGKILFKKLSYKDGTLIPRFWLEIEKAINEPLRAAAGRVPKEGEYLELRENTKFARVLNKYRFRTREEADAEGIIATKYIHIENSHDNYISLLCDENRTHYLAFLLEEELKYQPVDKPKPKRGGKPKRPKTATKRPKTAK